MESRMEVEGMEAVLSFLKTFYGLVDQVVKQTSVAGLYCPIHSITEVVERISSSFTPIIYSIIHSLQKGGKKDIHGKKQAKLIPDLIYAIEQFETSLIQISKKTKGDVNLTMFVRRSTTRDFRIDASVLSKRIETREVEGDEEGEGEKEKPRSSKRRKKDQ